MFFLSFAVIVIAEEPGSNVLDPAIADAFAKNSRYEHPTSEFRISDDEVLNYVHANWRWIARSIEVLPPAKGVYANEDGALNASVIAFAEICEKLPPEEYVEFLDQMVSLYEQGRVSRRAFDLFILPSKEKESFLSVNYAHPSVAEILRRATSLVPDPSDESLRSCLEDMASGALADNYLTNRSPDAPLPQTLPGIKLKRPWGSIIRRYERLTGKKLPPDPDFPEEVVSAGRPARRPGGGAGEVGGEPVGSSSGGVGPILWPGGLVVVTLGLAGWCWRKRGRRALRK